MRTASAVLAAALALALSAEVRAAAPPGKGRGGHPAVGEDQDCRGCHARRSPKSFQAWAQGKHGLDLVTCVVCHGAIGADFRPRPAADRCAGCHPEQAASLAAPFAKGKDCFGCHPAHGLDPHATSPARSAAAAVNADVELKRERELGPVNGPNPAAEPAKVPAAATKP